MPFGIEDQVIGSCAVEREPLCPHCRSLNVVEARSTPTEVIFRCLHCWRLFTRAV
jgi:hypothetical protein